MESQRNLKKISEIGKDLPCRWIGRINIIKMKILSKAVNRFSAVTIIIQAQFFTDLERTVVLNFIWRNKKPRIANTTLL